MTTTEQDFDSTDNLTPLGGGEPGLRPKGAIKHFTKDEAKRRIVQYPEAHAEATAHARAIATEYNTWVAVEQLFGKIDDRFIRLVDGDQGVIDIFLSISADLIHATSVIYNPKRGPQTLDTLRDIYQFLAYYLKKDIIQEEYPLHEHIRDLLIGKGFTRDISKGVRYIMTFSHSIEPRENYPNLIEMATTLLELRTKS